MNRREEGEDAKVHKQNKYNYIFIGNYNVFNNFYDCKINMVISLKRKSNMLVSEKTFQGSFCRSGKAKCIFVAKLKKWRKI